MRTTRETNAHVYEQSLANARRMARSLVFACERGPCGATILVDVDDPRFRPEYRVKHAVLCRRCLEAFDEFE